MSDTILKTKLGSITTLTDSTCYQSDPLSVYQLLCHQQENNILLESAEIDKKHLLKSLLLTDAAVKIVCNGNSVVFSALSVNGETAIQLAAEQLSKHAEISFSNENKSFQATFPVVPSDLDEKARLSAVNSLQSLRSFNQLIQDTSHPFAVFLGGVFAFDLIAIAEDLPSVKAQGNTCPDFVYYLAETLVVIDHELETTEIIGNVFTHDHINPGIDSQLEIQTRLNEIKQLLSRVINEKDVTALRAVQEDSNKNKSLNDTLDIDISDENFCEIVEKLKENIRAGDIFQVVPSRTFSLPCSDPIAAYKALKLSNPSPYMFYLKDSDFCIFGASPESAIKYQASNRHVEIYPIAGTRPRGFDKQGNISLDLDSRIELELRQDKKESAEHIMLVDLARNDIARVSQPGTRYVADLLKVDRYSHVMHLVSRVCGTLQEDLDALHAYQACMNMGTLSGAPKVKATSLIREVEGKRRGSYGGAVGYLTGRGEMNT